MELDQVELLGRDALPVHPVMVAGRALVEWAPDNGVGPLDHVSHLAEAEVLPLDELPVGGVDRRELPPPIDGEARVLQDLTTDLGVVGSQVLRVGELLDLLLGDSVDFDERTPHPPVPLLEPLAHADYGLASPVPCPGEEDVVPLHPLEAGVELPPPVSEGVPHMHGGVHVMVGDGDEDLLLPGDRIGLEDVLFVPDLQPVLFPGRQGAFSPRVCFRMLSTAFAAASACSTLGPPPWANAEDPPPEPPTMAASCLTTSSALIPFAMAALPLKAVILTDAGILATLT